MAYKQLSALGFDLGERSATLVVDGDTLTLLDGLDHAAVVAELAPDALSDLVQDRQSTMGLAMTARVKIRDGSLDDWIRWEPALRALFEGRPVYESGAITMLDPDGAPLDLTVGSRSTTTVTRWLTYDRAGFLHLTGVFGPDEMAAVGTDIDDSIAAARCRPGTGGARTPPETGRRQA